MKKMKDKTYAWLFQVPGRKKGYVLLLLIIQAIHGATGVFYALLLRAIVDAAVAGNRNGFFRSVIGIVLLVLFQLILRAVIRQLSEYTRAILENGFKERLTQYLLRDDYVSVSAVHTAEWQNRLTNDCVLVANHYAEIIPGITEMAVKLISAIILILMLEPMFAVIIFPFGILLMLFTWLFRAKMKRLHKSVQEADGRLRIFWQEHLSSLLMIHSFAAENSVARGVTEKTAAHKNARIQKTRFSNICNFGFGIAMNGMYLIGVAWCGYGILTGSVSFGTLTAIMQLISQIQYPFANITGYLPRFYAMLASAERLMEAEALPGAFTEPPLGACEIRRLYEKDLCAVGLSHVSFKYHPADPDAISSENGTPLGQGAPSTLQKEAVAALEDFSLELKKGAFVAFTGPSGCGKSTALKLLTCVFKPDEGECYYLDQAGNKTALQARHRKLFAYVPQGNQLMSGTIRDVVSFGEGDVVSSDTEVSNAPGASSDAGSRTDDKAARLQSALRIACAWDFVSQLPEGVETLLGERGAGLSEGQMQRIALARAIYSEAPILLLDESTSALDAATERTLLENLKQLKNRTVVIVTHRPAALEFCDQVIAFEVRED